MSKQAKASPGVYIILRKGLEALFMHRINTNYQPGTYMLPGGGVDKGESIVQAAIREVHEELGLDLLPKDLQPVYFMYRPPHDETGERADYFFVVDSWEGDPKIKEPHKCDELAWFQLENLPESIPEYIRVAIERWQKGEVFLDYGWKLQ